MSNNERHVLEFLPSDPGLMFTLAEDGATPVPASDTWAWSHWIQTHRDLLVVARSKVRDLDVSTIFTGLRLNLLDEEPPLLFETMAFDAEHQPLMQKRYATKAEAFKGHHAIVTTLREERR